jgi:hypothetical protein
MSYEMLDFLKDLQSNGIRPDDAVYDFLSSTDTERVKVLLARLDRVRATNALAIAAGRPAHHKYKTKKAVQAEQSRLLGRLLEQIMITLLNGCSGLKVLNNIRTTTSEIDFLIQVQPTGSVIPILKAAQTHIIGEAKCYSSGFKSTWVNELIGLMQLHSTSHSIIFTACPSKNLRSDHRHAIQLHGAHGYWVIPFGIRQVNEIAAGKNFLSILSDQYVRVLNSSADLSI